MLGESQLNVYILGDKLTPRQRQRIQVQVQTALRSIPGWAFDLLRARIESLGVQNLPLIVEPQETPSAQVLSLGMIESRPAARFLPNLLPDGVDWVQDQRYLVTKAVVYMAAPAPSDIEFWASWSDVVRADEVREEVVAIDPAWQNESERGLLVELGAAYTLNREDARWLRMPRVKSFLDKWRGTAYGVG